MYKLFSILIFVAFFCNSAAAQSTLNAFDVASIKPSDPNTRGVSFRNGPGIVDISGATVKLLIQQAYDVRESQISGGPGWMNSERYDIVAKVDPGSSLPGAPQNISDQGRAMEKQRERLRALLADRFQLKIRRDTKELPVYALIPAKSGPKLKESNLDAPAPVQAGDSKTDKPRGSFIRVGRGQIIGQAMSMSTLAYLLSNQLGRMVIDKTGLTGTYDFTLEWTPDAPQGLGAGFAGPGEPAPGKEAPRPDNATSTDPAGPSVFSAIQEQLGLRLESQRAPVEILVIENIERPSEN